MTCLAGGRQTDKQFQLDRLTIYKPPHLTTISMVVNKTVIVRWIFNFLLFHRIRYSTAPFPFARSLSFCQSIQIAVHCYTFCIMHRTIIIIMIEKFVFCCIFVSLPSYTFMMANSMAYTHNLTMSSYIIIFSFSALLYIIQYNSSFFSNSFFGLFSLYACIQLFVHFIRSRSIMHKRTHIANTRFALLRRFFSNKNFSLFLFDLASSFILFYPCVCVLKGLFYCFFL